MNRGGEMILNPTSVELFPVVPVQSQEWERSPVVIVEAQLVITKLHQT